MKQIWSIIDIGAITIIIEENYGKMIIDEVYLTDAFQIIYPQIPTPITTRFVAIPSPFAKTGFIGG